MEYYDITCPHCWQVFSIPLDVSVRGQLFVYDCEICCNPLEVEYEAEDGEIVFCEARSLEQ
jgi:hypothetical protein